MQYELDSMHYTENSARLLQCKENGTLLRYIIIATISMKLNPNRFVNEVPEAMTKGEYSHVYVCTNILSNETEPTATNCK